MEDKEIVSILKEIPFDLRAEVVISDLLTRGFTPGDFMIKPVGLFKRRYKKDIEKIERFERNNDQTPLVVNINREGFYDFLPQALFHTATRSDSTKTVDDMVEELKQHIKQEEDARKFFFAYETAFFKSRVSVEQMERKLIETISYRMDDEIILSYWDLPSIFDQRQKGILFYLFPVIHKIKCRLNLMEQTYSAVLNDHVRIKKNEEPANKKETGLNFNSLGNFRLSGDSVLGQRSYPVSEEIIIEIGPVATKAVFNYLPGENNRKIIEHLNSFFLPFNSESEIKILTEKSSWRLTSKDRNESRIGYSAFL